MTRASPRNKVSRLLIGWEFRPDEDLRTCAKLQFVQTQLPTNQRPGHLLFSFVSFPGTNSKTVGGDRFYVKQENLVFYTVTWSLWWPWKELSAGDKSTDGSTRNKTTQLLESLHFRAVLEGLKSHPNQNHKPVKQFQQLDKCSQAWLSALCSRLSAIPSPEFIEAMAYKFFVPSPACTPFVGQREVLMCANLPFDSWRLRHNTIQATLESIINESGVIANAEAYGLFSHIIPSAATSVGGDLQSNKDRQGLIPDFHITFPAEHGEASNNLAELKCISAGLTWYQSQQKAVDLKAKQIPNLYRNKARTIGTKYNGVTAGHVGPLEQRLRGFGDILCLVAGQYGDISQDFHDLLKKLASTKAQHISLLEGRPVSDSEQGLILHHLRRRISVSIITAQSRCLLTRLNHMAPAAKEAAKKRAFTKHWQQIEENDRLYHFEAYVKGRRLHEMVSYIHEQQK